MMNQNGMNNNMMNPMNFDQTAINIKNIVKPYEDKIKELEEIIRQKNFEITVLKQKLNNSNLNNNFMNMHLNPMLMNQNLNPMMMGNNYIPLEDKGTMINLTIKIDNNSYPVTCSSNDKVSALYKTVNLGDKNLDLTYNYKCLDGDWTLRENGIYYSSVIYAKSVMNVLFFSTSPSILSNLCLSKDCPIGLALIYYLIKTGNSSYITPFLNEIKTVSFLFNGSRLNIKDQTPIDNVFRNVYNPKVTVIFS